jgi:two-component system OmpR family sensor kinase
VTIRDKGIGIPADLLPHVFDRFYRVGDRSRANPQGLGLGLYIARSLVEAHGGSLIVTSTLGEGSTFTVSLPC